MKTFTCIRSFAVAALLASSLTACNTGTEAGDTNVERGAEKDLTPQANMSDNKPAGDSATAGMQRNANQAPTGRQVYEEGANRKDRNNDGLAD